jgi:ketosteroid isomerase-like protein
MMRIALALLLCASAVQAQTNALQDLVNAERAFARSSEEKTTQDAFIAVLATDAVLFRPTAVNGPEWFRAHPAPAEGLLRWGPQLAGVSAAGDLGYTTGPFESGRRGEAATGKGWFVSVWRRQPNGAWKLFLDLGISSANAPSVANAAAAFRAAPSLGTPPAAKQTENDVLTADRNFAMIAATSGNRAAFDRMVADSARLYRNGVEPVVGKEAIVRAMGGPTTIHWMPVSAGVARSGDLGYSYGMYDAANERGNYVRVWSRGTSGEWKLVLDITNASPPPPGKASDVGSLDAIIGALYDVISGPAGQKRDWDRFNSLFVPGARLIPTGKAQDGTVRHRVQTAAEYQATSGPALEQNGFFEKEVHRVADTYGNITQLFSTYESRRTAADAQPFARGINSIQLLNDGQRWWIVSIFWDSERADNPLPGKYLGK